MRQEPTPAEDVLWQALRNKALGAKFRRQHAIDRFIVDFCCLSAKIIVEVDGEIHRRTQAKDRERDDVLKGESFSVLRFSNDQVLHDLDTVLETIRKNF